MDEMAGSHVRGRGVEVLRALIKAEQLKSATTAFSFRQMDELIEWLPLASPTNRGAGGWLFSTLPTTFRRIAVFPSISRRFVVTTKRAGLNLDGLHVGEASSERPQESWSSRTFILHKSANEVVKLDNSVRVELSVSSSSLV